MSRTYHVWCLSEAVSPISHMSRREGNEAIVNAQRCVTGGRVRYLPVLSGNALRHRCARGPGGRWLLGRLGLVPASKRLANLLLHGGSLSESTARVDLGRTAELLRLLPFLRLLGCSLPDQIVPGSTDAHEGVLVCRENGPRLATLTGIADLEVPPSLRPAEDFRAEWNYTRSEAERTSPGHVRPPIEGERTDEQLMIFNGQAVAAGACFAHGFTLKHVSDLEVGALLLSLALWQDAEGGTIGGMASRGHGRLRTRVRVEPEVDAAQLMAAYAAHVESHRDAAADALLAAIDPKPDKPAKAGKGAKRATAESDV